MFAEFAAKEFPRAITRYHSTQSLHEPLLPLDDQVDQHVILKSCYESELCVNLTETGLDDTEVNVS